MNFKSHLKQLILGSSIFVIVGCQSIPQMRTYDSPELVIQHSEVVSDNYTSSVTLNGPQQYFDMNRNSATFFLLRTVVTGEHETTQLYVEIMQPSWTFYDRARFDNGEEAEFRNIDGRTSYSKVVELFAITVPTELLLERVNENRDLNVMVYGRGGSSKELTVQHAYLEGFARFREQNL